AHVLPNAVQRRTEPVARRASGPAAAAEVTTSALTSANSSPSRRTTRILSCRPVGGKSRVSPAPTRVKPGRRGQGRPDPPRGRRRTLARRHAGPALPGLGEAAAGAGQGGAAGAVVACGLPRAALGPARADRHLLGVRLPFARGPARRQRRSDRAADEGL